MPTFKPHELLNHLQAQTKGMVEKAQAEWLILPQQLLLYKPSAESWSATQCLMHLNAYGTFYLPAIKDSITKADNGNWKPEPQFRSGILGNWFTNMMLPDNTTHQIKKMKAPKAYLPSTNDNSTAVLQLFIHQQQSLLSLLSASQNVNLQRATTPISILPFVRLRLGDTFRFLVAHNQRHVQQAICAIEAAQGQAQPVLI